MESERDLQFWYQQPQLQKIRYFLRQQDRPVYLVGGAVRDGLRQTLRADADLDLVVAGGAIRLARWLADALAVPFFVLDAGRDVARVMFSDHLHLDVVAMRGGDLHTDLLLRDFTINAMAVSLTDSKPELIDPLGGRRDLEAGILRQAGPTAIQDDPLRALRALRLMLDHHLRFDPLTEAAVRLAGPALSSVSVERQRDEILRLLYRSEPSVAMGLLDQTGLDALIFPELGPIRRLEQTPPHRLPVWEHTMATLDAIATLVFSPASRPDFLQPFEADLQAYLAADLSGLINRGTLLLFAALWHDVGKSATYSQDETGAIHFFGHPQVGAGIAAARLAHWRFSKQAAQFVEMLVRWHMRPLLLAAEMSSGGRAIHRLLNAAGDTAPALTLLAVADHQATYLDEAQTGRGALAWQALGNVVSKLLARYFSPPLPPLLTGRDVIDTLQLQPGPQVGHILRQLREAQATAEVSTREEALSFIQNLSRG